MDIAELVQAVLDDDKEKLYPRKLLKSQLLAAAYKGEVDIGELKYAKYPPYKVEQAYLTPPPVAADDAAKDFADAWYADKIKADVYAEMQKLPPQEQVGELLIAVTYKGVSIAQLSEQDFEKALAHLKKSQAGYLFHEVR